MNAKKEIIATLLRASRPDLANAVSASFERVVAFDDFDAAFKRVMAGHSMFWVVTMTHHTPIKDKTIKKFKAAGYDLIAKSSDGKGFRMQQGRSKVYVLPGSLIETDPR